MILKVNVNVIKSRMEQPSLLSIVINYVQYNRNPIDLFKLDVKALEPSCWIRTNES